MLSLYRSSDCDRALLSRKRVEKNRFLEEHSECCRADVIFVFLLSPLWALALCCYLLAICYCSTVESSPHPLPNKASGSLLSNGFRISPEGASAMNFPFAREREREWEVWLLPHPVLANMKSQFLAIVCWKVVKVYRLCWPLNRYRAKQS